MLFPVLLSNSLVAFCFFPRLMLISSFWYQTDVLITESHQPLSPQLLEVQPLKCRDVVHCVFIAVANSVVIRRGRITADAGPADAGRGRAAVLPAGTSLPSGGRPVCQATRRGSGAGWVTRAREGRPRSELRTAVHKHFATRAGAWADSCPVAAVTNCHTFSM